MRERLIYQGVWEWGNRADGDGERITRRIEALSIPYHVAYAVIVIIRPSGEHRLMSHVNVQVVS